MPLALGWSHQAAGRRSATAAQKPRTSLHPTEPRHIYAMSRCSAPRRHCLQRSFVRGVAIILPLVVLLASCGGERRSEARSELLRDTLTSAPSTVAPPPRGLPPSESAVAAPPRAEPAHEASRAPVTPSRPRSLRANEPVSPRDPARVVIPVISVDASLVPVGLNPDQSMETPDFGVAGWYTKGPRPGEQGPAVIAAHVDSNTGPDVFFRLRELSPGDDVYVYRHDGSVTRFVVDWSEQTPKDDLPADRIWNDTEEAVLRLVTCGGTFDRSRGSYRDNVIVYADAA